MSVLGKNWIVKKIYKVAIILIFGYFIFRGTEFVFTILPYIPPDEKYHIDLIQLFSQHWMVSAQHLGGRGFTLPPQYMPYLYHFLLGKLLWLNVFPIPDYQFLRLINLVMASATVFVSYQIAKQLTENKLVQILSLLILTNLPAFSFISAGVSYDNLTNLLAALSVFFLISVLQDQRVSSILGWVIVVLFGPLVKITFLPIVAIEAPIILGNALFGQDKKAPRVQGIFNQQRIWTIIVIGAGILVGVWLNLSIYGHNLFKYHRLIPECNQVLSQQQCNYTKPVQRQAALASLFEDNSRVDFLNYLPIWSFQMAKSLLSHGGHKYLIASNEDALFLVLAVLVGLGFTFFRLIRRPGRVRVFLLLLAGFYSLSICWFTFMTEYKPTGWLLNAINGRYWLPVIFPVILILLDNLESLSWQRSFPVVIIIVIFFVVADYVIFKTHLTVDWTVGWYEWRERQEQEIGPYDYLESNVHTGEPYGWEIPGKE